MDSKAIFNFFLLLSTLQVKGVFGICSKIKLCEDCVAHFHCRFVLSAGGHGCQNRNTIQPSTGTWIVSTVPSCLYADTVQPTVLLVPDSSTEVTPTAAEGITSTKTLPTDKRNEITNKFNQAEIKLTEMLIPCALTVVFVSLIVASILFFRYTRLKKEPSSQPRLIRYTKFDGEICDGVKPQPSYKTVEVRIQDEIRLQALQQEIYYETIYREGLQRRLAAASFTSIDLFSPSSQPAEVNFETICAEIHDTTGCITCSGGEEAPEVRHYEDDPSQIGVEFQSMECDLSTASEPISLDNRIAHVTFDSTSTSYLDVPSAIALQPIYYV